MPPPAAAFAIPRGSERKDPKMRPVRAFMLSFTAGLAILFSGHGLVTVALADPPSETITV